MINETIMIINDSNDNVPMIMSLLKKLLGQDTLKIQDLRLNQMLSGDIVGLPYIDPNTGEDAYRTPLWLHNGRDSSKVILVSDFENAEPASWKYLFEMIFDRKVEYHGDIPKDWRIILLVTPEEAELFDPFILNKLLVFDFRGEFKWEL